MNVVFFTKHENLGASSRYRSIQYFPIFQMKNINVIHKPLFTDEYLQYKYAKGKAPIFLTMLRLLNRGLLALYYLLDRRSVVVIEKELLPYFPAFLEFLYKLCGRKYFLDYDDAVWHNYDRSNNRLIRLLLSNKHKRIISWSSGVTSGSQYIMDYVLKSGAKNTIKLPTVIDLDLYKTSTNIESRGNPFVIGWIGSPSSSQYLKLIESPLKRLTDEHNVVVHLIGVDKKVANTFTFKKKVISWDAASENKELNKFDVGVMPLQNGEFEKGKCSFKLIQYMGMSKPVICSPVGENANVVKHGVTGFLASNDTEWYEMIKTLILQPITGEKMGLNGRKLVEEHYSLQAKGLVYFKFLTGKN
jgi:glycosyltransferase involved in cell wall biosynthesis